MDHDDFHSLAAIHGRFYSRVTSSTNTIFGDLSIDFGRSVAFRVSGIRSRELACGYRGHGAPINRPDSTAARRAEVRHWISGTFTIVRPTVTASSCRRHPTSSWISTRNAHGRSRLPSRRFPPAAYVLTVRLLIMNGRLRRSISTQRTASHGEGPDQLADILRFLELGT